MVREDFDALSSESSDISDDIEAVDSSEWSDSWLSSAATSSTPSTRGFVEKNECKGEVLASIRDIFMQFGRSKTYANTRQG